MAIGVIAISRFPSFLINDARVSSTVIFLPSKVIDGKPAKAEVVNREVKSEVMMSFFMIAIPD